MDLLILLGNFYFQQKRTADAEKSYLQAIEKSPQDLKLYMVAAGFYQAAGKKEQALAMLQKARELKPDDIGIMNALAQFISIIRICTWPILHRPNTGKTPQILPRPHAQGRTADRPQAVQ